MIKNGMVVNLAYRLTNTKGETLDEANSAAPFTYLHGVGQIIPGLENAVVGLKAGDKKKVVVPPTEGYGELNPELKLTVKRSQFPPEAKLEAGMHFQAEVGGDEVMFRVESIDGEKVNIDGNHPLAGETLHFDLEVLSAREATADEVKHGHAHGEGEECEGGGECCGGHGEGGCCEDKEGAEGEGGGCGCGHGH